jgi:hypothetical protein
VCIFDKVFFLGANSSESEELAVWEPCFAVFGMTEVILVKVHVCICVFTINGGVDVVLIV